MNQISRIGLGVLLGATCAASAFAEVASVPYDQSTPKTRADVIADLRAWMAAGYDPSDWINYPENALRAARIVAERRAQAAGAGGATNIRQ
ncbi:DUF4148 domain-containing protein [Burkholderia sp. MR1-5-21]